MTEQEWLTSKDPAEMLENLRTDVSGKPTFISTLSDRKFRLWACQCSRMSGNCNEVELARWEQSADALFVRNWAEYSTDKPSKAERAALMRDVVGNPFRPVTLPAVRKRVAIGPFVIDVGTVDEGFSNETYCPWLTPQVLSLARAAYEERGRECKACGGEGKVEEKNYHGAWDTWDCAACHGTGLTDDGTLDLLRLALVADALEEAGAVGECIICKGTKRTIDAASVTEIISRPMGMDAASVAIEAIKAGIIGNKVCLCNRGRSEHPLLTHLRSLGPHVRGCWVLDLILGKE